MLFRERSAMPCEKNLFAGKFLTYKRAVSRAGRKVHIRTFLDT